MAYVLSAAVPRDDCYGGLHEIATRRFVTGSDELGASVAGLHDWMRKILAERRAPLGLRAPIGLYVGECVLPDHAESGRDWLSEESLAWYDNGELPIGSRPHPSLAG